MFIHYLDVINKKVADFHKSIHGYPITQFDLPNTMGPNQNDSIRILLSYCVDGQSIFFFSYYDSSNWYVGWQYTFKKKVAISRLSTRWDRPCRSREVDHLNEGQDQNCLYSNYSRSNQAQDWEKLRHLCYVNYYWNF